MALGGGATQGTIFFPRNGAETQSLGWSFRDHTHVHQMRGNRESPELLLPRTTGDDPRLAEILPNMWAKNKYDEGHTQNVDPLVVTPKSTHRPRQPQYRVNQV